jgi:hypothetical protein
MLATRPGEVIVQGEDLGAWVLRAAGRLGQAWGTAWAEGADQQMAALPAHIVP